MSSLGWVCYGSSYIIYFLTRHYETIYGDHKTILTHELLVSFALFTSVQCIVGPGNWPNSQIPECTCSISHNAPFRTEMWDRCIQRFLKLFYCNEGAWKLVSNSFDTPGCAGNNWFLVDLVIHLPIFFRVVPLAVRSCKVSKQRDLYIELSDCSQIWQAPRQHCYPDASQILKRWDNLYHQSRGFTR